MSKKTRKESERENDLPQWKQDLLKLKKGTKDERHKKNIR